MCKQRECPFCGSNDVRTKTSAAAVTGGLTMVLCYGCGATVSFDRKERKDQAIGAWNARTCDAGIEVLKDESLGLALRLNEALRAKKELDDAMERGELMRAPVKLGRQLFQPYEGEIIVWDVGYVIHDICGDISLGCLQADDHDLSEEFLADVIGTKLYQTREEAEAALVKKPFP